MNQSSKTEKPLAGQINSQPIDYRTLTDMPAGELAGLAEQIGLQPPAHAARVELLDLVRRRLELIEQLDKQALLDIVVWARRPVRKSADKLELIREISQARAINYQQLSHAGLHALAALRNLQVDAQMPADQIVHQLYRADGIKGWVTRKRRKLIASVLHKLIDSDDAQDSYQFLPEQASQATLKEKIEQHGVVDGLASTIRGAADNYIDRKLDQIELRIDHKLEQIDQRLAQWRDQEVANRLRIIKITLIASVIVAFVSFCYSYIKTNYMPPVDAPPVQQTSSAAQDNVRILWRC